MCGAVTRPRAWAQWVVPALVVLLTLKTTWGVLGTFDIGFDDETIYLEAAHWAGKRFLPLADSSPLYPLWYRALSWFEPDPVRLYFVNWFILTAALPPLLYALARRSGAPLAGAAAVSVLWSMSAPVMTWPYVTRFAALVLGLGALAATSLRDRRLAAAVTAGAMALASYARAELSMPSFVFAGAVVAWSVFTLVRGRERTTRSDRVHAAIAIGIAIAVPLGLRALFGDHQGGRAFFAFGQHYALNVVEAKQLQVDPWVLWERFAREAFPHATTISEAARENPAAFAWHLRRNFSTSSRAVSEVLEPLQFVPRVIATVGIWALRGTVVAGALGLVRSALRRWSEKWGTRLDPRLGAWVPLFLALGVTTAGSALLIYPREHYLLPLVWLSLALLAAGAKGLSAPDRLRALWESRSPQVLRMPGAGSIVLVAALGCLLVALPTRRETIPSLLASREPMPPRVHENLRTIDVIRHLELRGPIAILEPDHSRGFYAGLDYRRVAQWDKDAPFATFLRARPVDIVVITPRLRQDPRFASDTEFVVFADGTGGREDFEVFPVPETAAIVAVRKSVLARSR